MLAGRAAIATGGRARTAEVLVIDEASCTASWSPTPSSASSSCAPSSCAASRCSRPRAPGDPHRLALAPDTHRLRQFLTRNGQPHAYLDLEDDADTAAVLERFGVGADELPVVITVDGQVLRTPTIGELADASASAPIASTAATSTSW